MINRPNKYDSQLMENYTRIAKLSNSQQDAYLLKDQFDNKNPVQLALSTLLIEALEESSFKEKAKMHIAFRRVHLLKDESDRKSRIHFLKCLVLAITFLMFTAFVVHIALPHRMVVPAGGSIQVGQSSPWIIYTCVFGFIPLFIVLMLLCCASRSKQPFEIDSIVTPSKENKIT